MCLRMGVIMKIKDLLINIIGIVIIAFAIPILLTTHKTRESSSSNTSNEDMLEDMSAISEYNYSEYNTIKVLHSKTDEIEEMNIDDYLLRSCCSGNASKL